MLEPLAKDFTFLILFSSDKRSAAWSNDHRIDFDNASIIDTGNYRIRKTLESWHTAATNEADNNSCPLSRQYYILLSNSPAKR